MNQPKFNFGDIVKDKLNGREFHVRKIELTRNGFFYAGKDQNQLAIIGCGQYEENLEIYQEPKKKKLKAIEYKDGEVRFFSGDISPLSHMWKRAPEFDIEYPEK